MSNRALVVGLVVILLSAGCSEDKKTPSTAKASDDRGTAHTTAPKAKDDRGETNASKPPAASDPSVAKAGNAGGARVMPTAANMTTDGILHYVAQLTDAMCACSTLDCGMELAKELMRFRGVTRGWAKSHKVQAKQIEQRGDALHKRYTRCKNKLRDQTKNEKDAAGGHKTTKDNKDRNTDSVELNAYADAMCRCKVVKCVSAVKAKYGPWRQAYKNKLRRSGDMDRLKRFTDVEKRIAHCMKNVSIR